MQKLRLVTCDSPDLPETNLLTCEYIVLCKYDRINHTN